MKKIKAILMILLSKKYMAVRFTRDSYGTTEALFFINADTEMHLLAATFLEEKSVDFKDLEDAVDEARNIITGGQSPF